MMASASRMESITVAGRMVPLPARFRYDDSGDDSTYRYWADAIAPQTPTADISFCTNRHGEGLWCVDRHGGYHQLMGTGQFSATNLAQFKRRLRKFLAWPK